MEARSYYDDPERYEAEVAPFSLDSLWYRQRVSQLGGPALELGCGTGRILLLIAADGIEVDGLDLSAPMLARAKTRALLLGPTLKGRVGFFQKDMRTFSLKRRYRVVYAALNTLMHLLTDEDALACFRSVRRHIEPEGRFLFDVASPHPELLEAIPNPRGVPLRSLRVRGLSYLQSERHFFDPKTSLTTTTFMFDPEGHPGPAFSTTLRLRMFQPPVLERLLDEAGFQLTARQGGFTGQLFNDESVVQLIEARPTTHPGGSTPALRRGNEGKQ